MKLLWIWVVLTAFTNGMSIAFSIVAVAASTKGTTAMISICLAVGIRAFSIYCVVKRIQDITVNQAVSLGEDSRVYMNFVPSFSEIWT